LPVKASSLSCNGRCFELSNMLVHLPIHLPIALLFMY
jgi:hypothetical protein